MKVFLSWSGRRSEKVAILLRDWLSCVIQSTRPWISSRDIDRGALWFTEINDQLKETSVGIVCLTHENKEKPWILFEAGALAKGLSSSRLCTFLVDLDSADIKPPLSQFNHTQPNRESMLSLVRTINDSLSSGSLETSVLERSFATYWPQFEADFRQILEETPQHSPTVPRKTDDMLAEILEATRSLSNRMSIVERSAALRSKNSRELNLADNEIHSNRVYLSHHLKPESVVDQDAIVYSMAREALVESLKKIGMKVGNGTVLSDTLSPDEAKSTGG